MRKTILLSHGFQSEYECGIANGIAHSLPNTILIGSNTTQVKNLNKNILFKNLRGDQSKNRGKFKKIVNIVKYYYYYSKFIMHNYGSNIHLIGLFSTKNKFFSLLELFSTRILSKNLLLTVHNIVPHDDHGKLSRKISAISYKIPDKLIVHTPKIKKTLCDEFNIRPEKIYVIEHGINKFEPFNIDARQKIRGRLGLKQKDRLILFFGHMAWYKGPDILVNSFGYIDKSENTHLLIAGQCRDQKIFATINDLINQSAAKSRIYWQEGFIPDEEVRNIFFAADALIMPYRHIDQSGVLFMAMATGLQVVATDVGDLSRYSAKHPIKIVNIDQNEIREAINNIQQIPDSERSRMIENAKIYDWKNTVKPLIEIYK